MSALDTLSRVVVFRVDDGLFGIDVAHVERVVRHTTPRHVPRLPAWIAGVIELDERLVPVVDVRDRLSPLVASPGLLTRLLLLSLDTEWCALMVDQVLDVRVYSSTELVSPPPMVRDRAGGLVVGALKRGADTILCIDPRVLFSSDERLVIGDLAGQAAHG